MTSTKKTPECPALGALQVASGSPLSSCMWFQTGRVSIYKEVWLGFLLPTPSPVEDREDLTKRGRTQPPWSPCLSSIPHIGFSLCVCLLHLPMSRDLAPESSCRNSAVGDILARVRGRSASCGHLVFLTWSETLSQGEAKKAGALWPVPPWWERRRCLRR